MHESEPAVGPPATLLSLLEWRAFLEFYGALGALPWLRRAPRGDGHPVVVVPGFLSDHRSTWLLRLHLKRLGYFAVDWGQGRNVGPIGKAEGALLALLRELRHRTGLRPSLLGWSLGGVYARVLAHHAPEDLRSVITLGSPLRFPHRSVADTLYQRISGQTQPPDSVRGIFAAPPVPASSIYSRMDGVVSWRSCLSEESAQSENIRVCGSHCGLASNARVLWIVADRLSQPEGNWRRYTPPAAALLNRVRLRPA